MSAAATTSLGLRQPTVVLADHGVSLCLPVELPIGEEGGYFAGLTALGGGVEGGGAEHLGSTALPLGAPLAPFCWGTLAMGW